YQYKDANYQSVQKDYIQSAYGNIIMDDKMFPGGNQLFRKDLEPSLGYLMKINETNQYNAKLIEDSLMKVFIGQLRIHQTLDSAFGKILLKGHIDSTLSYALCFNRLELFISSKQKWTTIFSKPSESPSSLITGKLQYRNSNNKILELAVSDGDKAVYRFTYSLYADYPNRAWRILKQMWPILLVSIISLAAIVFLNYKTYQNWMAQRKLATLQTSFLDHIRHEFNTPLTTILVSSHNLIERKDELSSNEIQEFGSIIERQTSRLRHYFSQVMSSISLRDQIPDLQNTDVNQYFNEVIHELSITYQNRIQIDYKLLHPDTTIRLDSKYSFGILDNLISNAEKFNNDENKKINFSWITNKETLSLVVKDNGLGISNVDIKNVFTPFYRSKSTEKIPGLGLGLYYVKTCAEKMGWHIAIDETKGQGTTIVIEIPIK
ncbi:MAG: hypothetical protein DI598_17535, partial [Pseudopedobacter saltans]